MQKIFIILIALLIGSPLKNLYAHEGHHDSTNISPTMQQEMAEHQQMEAISDFPNYHPLIVHFPIVLLLMALLFHVLSFFFFKNEFGWTTLILLGLAVLSTWLASNLFHAMPGKLTGRAKEILDIHEQMANMTWWIALAALLIKVISVFFLKKRLLAEIAVGFLLLGSAITVSIAGHHGAMLVYMQGIGPEGKYLEDYRLSKKVSNSVSKEQETPKSDMTGTINKLDKQAENHHVGERGKGAHGGTIEEADPYHIEIVSQGTDFVFYLLDGDAKTMNMKNVTGSLKIEYEDKSTKKIELMEMGGKLTAMEVDKRIAFKATCTLIKEGKTYSALFSSDKDLPQRK